MPVRVLRWARERGRGLPHVRWRDRKIVALTQAVDEASSVDVPSYRRYIYAERRIAAMMPRRGDRGQLVTRKLKSYAFAQSHGVDIPRVFDVWDRPEDIEWDDLPAALVLKSNGGSGAQGVVPIRRDGDHWRIVRGVDVITSAQIVERLRKRQDQGRIKGPFFAEELLPGVDDDSLPVDVKVHAFYGEVGLVLLRSVDVHGVEQRFRAILPDGTDYGRSCPKDVYDATIPIPTNFPEVVRTAERLSLGVPRPFVRVDLYDIGGRVVFGEFTPRPGGVEDYGPELDAQLGRLCESAQSRVRDDAIGGAGYGLRFGPGPRVLQLRHGTWSPESMSVSDEAPKETRE
jgi:hypothetical protein